MKNCRDCDFNLCTSWARWLLFWTRRFL